MVRQILISMAIFFNCVMNYILCIYLSTTFFVLGQENKINCNEELWNGIILYKDVDIQPYPKNGIKSLIKIISTDLIIEDNIIKKLGLVDVRIIFEFVVDSSGVVIYHSIIEKNPYITIEKSLFDKIKYLQWEAGKCDGLNVTSLIRIPFVFQID